MSNYLTKRDREAIHASQLGGAGLTKSDKVECCSFKRHQQNGKVGVFLRLVFEAKESSDPAELIQIVYCYSWIRLL